ncbi:hypothetical protein JL721_2102 [Aureococcus anophagefferens]|nr:hypothetical protein JL721_2102 [Aureococcus anophagefferens]
MGSLVRALVARAGACAAAGASACDGATVGDDGMPVAERSYSRRELGEHRSAKNCWVAINSSVFDVTAFLAQHPGGASALQQYCGKDGSSAFGALHGAGVLADVGGPYRVGALAPDGGAAIMTSATPAGFQHPTGEALASGAAKKAFDGAPRLDADALADLRSLDDVEEAALALLPEALALYVNYGAEDETSKARNRRRGPAAPPGIAAHMTWDDVAWMRTASSLKVVVKGVMTREDAEIAAATADGIVVSNHGGRQLDGVAGTAEVLRDVLEILEDELKRTMALCGCETLADITPAHVAPPPAPPPRLDWTRAETADGAPYWYVSTWDPPAPVSS